MQIFRVCGKKKLETKENWPGAVKWVLLNHDREGWPATTGQTEDSPQHTAAIGLPSSQHLKRLFDQSDTQFTPERRFLFS